MVTSVSNSIRLGHLWLTLTKAILWGGWARFLAALTGVIRQQHIKYNYTKGRTRKGQEIFIREELEPQPSLRSFVAKPTREKAGAEEGPRNGASKTSA